MKSLLLLRHAKSSRKDPTLEDHQRPLNKRGRRDAPRIGALLAAEGLLPEVIISSTARRARQTAEAVAEAADYHGPLMLRDELYLATVEEHLALLATVADAFGSVLFVGHNPGLEELLDALTGCGEPLPTAALARVALEIKSWDDVPEHPRGRLVQLWRPRELE